MWELETSSPNKYTKDDMRLKLYSASVNWDSIGRYTVALPFKNNPSELGKSYNLAKIRLLNLKQKLTKNPVLRDT